MSPVVPFPARPRLFRDGPAREARPRADARGRAVVLLLVAAVLAFAVSPAEAAKKKRRPTRRSAAIPAVPRPHDPFEVTFSSPDGVKLFATWRPAPAAPAAPAVLLVHAFSRERRDFAELAGELGALGFSTLALDLRGHGESVRKGGAPISLGVSLQGSPNAFPRDVEAACAWLRGRASRVGVLGLSLSGNLAALATASGWAEAGVAVSANAERLEALAGTRPKAPRALLVLASEGDPGRAASARALDAAGREPKSIVLFPGTAHALDLLRQEPSAKDTAFGWLSARLGPVPPPPVATAPPATVPTPSRAEPGE